MATFEPVFRNRKYFKYTETAPGTVLAEGKYAGQVEGTYGIQHLIHLADGSEAVLNSSGHLNFLLKQVNIGDNIQVTYLGKEKCTKGKFAGKDAHNFAVAKESAQ
jgi:hypothetical protein